MGGGSESSSSTSSSTTTTTNTTRETDIRDTRAQLTDSAVAATAEGSRVTVQRLDNAVIQGALDQGRRLAEAVVGQSGNVADEAFDFAKFSAELSAEGQQEATREAIKIAAEQSSDDAKEIVGEFGRYLLLGTAAVAAVWLWKK